MLTAANEDRKWLYATYGVMCVLGAYLLHRFIFALCKMIKVNVFMLFDKIPISTIGAIALVAVAFYLSLKRTTMEKFTGEVITELKRVSWPNRKETTGSTVVVLVVVLFFGIYFGLWDFIWTKVLQVIL